MPQHRYLIGEHSHAGQSHDLAAVDAKRRVGLKRYPLQVIGAEERHPPVLRSAPLKSRTRHKPKGHSASGNSPSQPCPAPIHRSAASCPLASAASRSSTKHQTISATAQAATNGEASWRNLGIAATALSRWDVARRAWRNYGLDVPDADSPIGGNFGNGPVRINPTAT